jgi:LL-diaminopimelate aminotransferase
MSLSSWLPPAEENLFQGIKQMSDKAEADGQKLYKLSIGQPMGAALLSARRATAEAIMSDEQRVHGYQDNDSPGCLDFAPRFVQAHLRVVFPKNEVAYLPTPGTKPLLGLVIKACGAGIKPLRVKTHTRPGYPTPAVWVNYWGVDHGVFPTKPENGFMFKAADIFNSSLSKGSENKLAMMNFPHNPTGVIASRDWWWEICAFCAKHNIRLFNDAAYAALAFDQDQSCLLAEVAIEFPELSWCEAYSASKVLGNACGWRIGALVGSSDFIGDISRIKGETDSGFNAALATGVVFAVENDQSGIADIREMYKKRMKTLIDVLTDAGMQLAVEPQAGFFSLWRTPRRAFNQEIKTAKEFNRVMIANTGIVGVHFEPYIRYATCAPLEDPEFIKAIRDGFNRAQITY